MDESGKGPALDTEDDYQRPLAVQIAALLHVAGVDAEGGQGMASLLCKILGLEYDYWDKALRIGRQSNWSQPRRKLRKNRKDPLPA